MDGVADTDVDRVHTTSVHRPDLDRLTAELGVVGGHELHPLAVHRQAADGRGDQQHGCSDQQYQEAAAETTHELRLQY